MPPQVPASLLRGKVELDVSPVVRWSVRVGVFLAVVLGGLALETQRRVVQLADAYPPQGNLRDLGGVRLHYAIAGSGPPVLLLHGCPGFLQDWQITVPGATSAFDDLARDHTVIALDRPGYGWSGLPDGGPVRLAAQADVAEALLAGLHVDRVTVVGHSYGASLALALAVRHPQLVANLVLVGPAMYPEGLVVEPVRRAATWPIAGPLLRHCMGPLALRSMAGAQLTAVFLPDAPPPRYVDTFVAFLHRPEAQWQMGFELVHLPADLAAQMAQYARIDVPVTVIYGDREHPATAAGVPRLAEAVPHTRVVKLEGIGHEVQHLRPHVVTAEVRRLTHPAEAPAPAPAE